MITDRSDWLLYFSFAAGEFADEECFYIVERIVIHEGKTHEQVEQEIKDHWEERKAPGLQHPFQTWGSPELLKRIRDSEHVKVD